MIYYKKPNQLNTIFVEITKNASSSVRKTLSGNGAAIPDHSTYDMMVGEAEANGLDVSNFYKFVISRNPYDRFCSGWEYMQVAMRWPKSFDETLDYLIECQSRATGQPITVTDADGNPVPGKSNRALDGQLQYWWDDAPILLWPQTGFIKSKSLNGNVAITNFFKIEEIDTHWPTIAAAINQISDPEAPRIPNVLPVHNALPDRPDYNTYFQGELGATRIQKINSLYSEDFQVFNYQTR